MHTHDSKSVPSLATPLLGRVSRRFFLKRVPLATLAVSLPVPEMAMTTPETLEQRRDRLANELHSVVSEITGSVWSFVLDPVVGVVFMAESRRSDA